jgi:predicted transcriptional regulator
MQNYQGKGEINIEKFPPYSCHDTTFCRSTLGVLAKDHVAEIRRRHFMSGESIRAIAKSLKLSRPTVRKMLKAETEPFYQRQVQPTPKLGDFKEQLTDWLEKDGKLPKRQRRTTQRLFECLQVEGYQGS